MRLQENSRYCQRNCSFLHCWWIFKMVQKAVCSSSLKSQRWNYSNSTVPLLSVYSKELKAQFQIDAFMPMSSTALFTVVKGILLNHKSNEALRHTTMWITQKIVCQGRGWEVGRQRGMKGLKINEICSMCVRVLQKECHYPMLLMCTKKKRR